MADNLWDDNDPAAEVALGSAWKANPDQKARAQALAARLGVAPATAEAEFDLLDARVKTDDALSVLADAPKTRAWFSDPDNAAVAHDQVKELSALEWLLKPDFDRPGRLAQGYADFVRSLPAGAVRAGGLATQGLGSLGEIADRRVSQLQGPLTSIPTVKALQSFAAYESRVADRTVLPKAAKSLKGAADVVAAPKERQGLHTDVGEGVGQLGLQIPLAWLTGGAGSLAFNATQGAGIMDERVQANGKQGTVEGDLAVTGGAVLTAALEKIGLDKLLERVPPAMKSKLLSTVADLGIAGGIEAAQEGVESTGQNALEKLLLNEDADLFEGVGHDAQVGGMVGLLARAGINAVLPGRQVAHDERRAAAAPVQAETFEQAVEVIRQNPMLQRSPDRLKTLLDQVTDGEQVFVPAEKLVEYFQGKRLDPATLHDELMSWGVADQWAEAVAAGADVVFDKSAYLAKVAPTEAHDFWKDDLRLGLDAMSPNEAKAFTESYDDLIEKATRDAYDAAVADDAAAAPYERVFQDVQSKLREAGYTLDAATQKAALLAARYEARAVRNPAAYPDAWRAYAASGLQIETDLPDAVRENVGRLDVVIAALKRDKAPKRERGAPSLAEFLSRQGGIVDEGGDLAAMGADRWHVGKKPGTRKLIRSAKAGEAGDFSLDRMRERAEEAGYLPEGSTPRDLLDALDGELRGRPVMSMFEEIDGQAEDMRRAVADLDELLGRLGVDATRATNAEIKAAVERAQRSYAQGDTAPVARLTGEEIAPLDADVKDLRKAAKEWFAKNLAGRDLESAALGSVHIGRKGEKKAFSQSADPRKLRVFASLPEIIAKGRLVQSSPSYYAREFNVRAYHQLEATVELNGVPLNVALWVREDANGEFYYDHRIVEPAASGELAHSADKAATGTPEADAAPSDPEHTEYKSGAGEGRGGPGGETSYDQSVLASEDNFNLSLSQPADGSTFSDPRGRITFTDYGATIRLFASRDLSTFLHESGHLWLDEMVTDAFLPGASVQMKADLEAVLAWVGAGVRVADGEAAVRNGIEVDHHEQFARGTEAYLMEGRAPSEGLRGAFSKFKAWLVSIYRTVRALNAPLTDDIRGVMDRLIATDEEIAAAQKAAGLIDALPADALGMTDAEHAAYVRTVEKAKSGAHDALLNKVMAAVRRKRTAAWKDEAEALRPEVAEGVDAAGDLRALAFLREGKLALSRRAVVDLLGDEAGLALLPGRVPPLYTDKVEGVHPDDVADAAGFSTGAEMLHALMSYKAEADALKANGDKRSVRAARIEAEVERIMADRHGDVLSDGSIEAEALEVIHSERQAEVLGAELRALGRKAGAGPTPLQALRAFAAKTIAEKRVRDGIAAGRYLRAERKAANAVQDALAKGDAAEAFRQKQAQTLNHLLYTEARKAAADVEKAARVIGKFVKAKSLKSMDQDYLDQIHDLAERFDFGTVSDKEARRRQSLAAFIVAKEAEGETVYVPDHLRDEAARVPYREMTVEQLRGLYDAVTSLAHLGRLKKTLRDGQERRAFDSLVDEAVAGAGHLPPRPPSKRVGKKRGAEAAMSGLREADAYLLKFETIADWLDGNDPNGVFNRVLVRPATEAANLDARLREEVAQPITAAFNAIPKAVSRKWEHRVQHDLIDPESGQRFDLRRGDLLAIAANVGNESNLDKLLRGYEWDEAAVLDLLNRELTSEEWAFVQATWDGLDKLWPHIAATEKRLTGVEPERVEPREVATPHGTFRGGYFPVVYDPERDANADRNAKLEAADVLNVSFVTAATAKGHTKARTDYAAPLLLDLNAAVLAHTNKAIKRVAYGEFVADALRFMRDKRIRKLVQDKLGLEYYDGFVPWLQRQVNDNLLPTRGVRWWSNLARGFRLNWQIAVMGFSVTTGASQVAGLANSAAEIGPEWAAHGVQKTARLAITGQLDDYVFARSDEMRTRNNELDRDLRDAMLELQGKKGPLSAIQQAAMWHIGFMDRYSVSTPTWVGAFDKALADGYEEADAVAIADKAVRKSQGSGRPKDLAQVQSDSEWMKLFTLAYSYFNVLYNRQRDVAMAAQTGDYGRAFAYTFWIMGVAPLAGALLTGDWPDEDDSWWAWAGRKTFFGLFAGVPLIRDAASVADRKLGGKFAAFGSTPISRTGESLFKLAKDATALVKGEEPSDRAVQHVFDAAGLALRLPGTQTGKTAQYLWDLVEGDQRPDGVIDVLTGLAKGPQDKQR